MPTAHVLTSREKLPTRVQALAFAAKATLFRLRRWKRESFGRCPRPLLVGPRPPEAQWVAESRTPLYASDAAAEFALQAGKVQNLRAAARCLHGLVLPAGEVFSFWANVPRPTRRRGFAEGRELREGCIIPSVGGGLCQLSNALYDVALQAGCEIVERHAHSRQMPGSRAAEGRDATIFWNYVDLRFRARSELHLTVRVEPHELVVSVHAADPAALPSPQECGTFFENAVPDELTESCETCGITECFRHSSAALLPRAGATAWLVDAFMPEHDAWMTAEHDARDWLFVPLDSTRFRIGPYRWNTRNFTEIREARALVLRRSWVSRRLAAQGAERQRALLRMDAALAEEYARRLPPLATHLVVSQNLLPFLWRRGELGGRTFDVLMTRLPLADLQATLDRAASRCPESDTLADFRAPSEIVEAETAALAAARRWITPHTMIARLSGARAVQLDWQRPPAPRVERGEWIAFPASTLARKGACELRTVARELGLPVRLAGPVLEAPDFWAGVRTERAPERWLDGARAVVLPAWVEHQPRRLLQALAAGVPVIASEACGLGQVPGVTTIRAGDVEALRKSLRLLERDFFALRT